MSDARASLLPLRERGRAEVAHLARERAENVSANIERGKGDVRRSFVFRFYHDTMTDTNLSGAYHKYGPESPDPDIRPGAEPGPLGGQYHNVDWFFEWDGIQWRASFSFGYESWGLDFYVLRPRRWFTASEWRIVHAPWQVVEALA